MLRKNCLMCNSSKLNDIINLGMHPFADTFVPKSKIHLSEKVYPLIVQLCKSCGNIQLKCPTEPEERYQDYEYSYTSSNSSYSKNYWSKYCKEILKLFSHTSKLKILEIGSNDCYLLSLFKKMGHNVLGIDASSKMNEIASRKGIKTKLGIFNEKLSKIIHKQFGNFDLIIANNVFNHSDNPQSFLNGVWNLLKYKGIFTFESPYWLNSIKSGKFDQIYHEHITYPTTKSINQIISKNNMQILDIVLTPYHGGSIRYIVSNKKDYKILNKVKKFISKETKLGLYSFLFYKKFMKNLNQKKNIFMKKIYGKSIKLRPLICIGAAAKSNTFLNFYGLNNKLVNYVTNSSKYKIGKYTPLTRIVVTNDKIIKQFKKPNIIFTAWNISDNLKKIIYKLNPNCNELKPYGN